MDLHSPGLSRFLNPATRPWNIALRTAHIAAAGILLGGHAFDVPAERLLVGLWACILSGLGLTLSEAGWSLLWFHQLRGLMTLGKLLLIGAVPLFWDQRVWILLVVVVIASVGSHMPARFRYYSVVYHRMIRGSCGPGGRPGENEQEDFFDE